MTLRLNGTTSGYVEIDSASTGGNNTIVLPSSNGNANQFLQTNGSGITSWASQRILQVVNATYSTEVTSSSTTYIDTGLSGSITPSSSSNKILVIISQAGFFKTGGHPINAINLKLFRGSTELAKLADSLGYTGTSIEQYPGSVSAVYLDSPGSTSSLTYKTQFANVLGASYVAVQRNNAVSTIALLEVAA